MAHQVKHPRGETIVVKFHPATAVTLSPKKTRHEISRLNRIAKKHPIFLDHVGESVLSDNEGEVLRIRIYSPGFLAGRWQLRLEARKGLCAEVKVHDEILEVGKLKSLQLGDSCSWVVFSLPEGDYDFKFRPAELLK